VADDLVNQHSAHTGSKDDRDSARRGTLGVKPLAKPPRQGLSVMLQLPAPLPVAVWKHHVAYSQGPPSLARQSALEAQTKAGTGVGTHRRTGAGDQDSLLE
jgi:hypothetical protein